MTPTIPELLERVRRRAEFDEKALWPIIKPRMRWAMHMDADQQGDFQRDYEDVASYEHARLTPIIEELLSIIEEQAKGLRLTPEQDRTRGYPIGSEWIDLVENVDQVLASTTSRLKKLVGE